MDKIKDDNKVTNKEINWSQEPNNFTPEEDKKIIQGWQQFGQDWEKIVEWGKFTRGPGAIRSRFTRQLYRHVDVDERLIPDDEEHIEAEDPTEDDEEDYSPIRPTPQTIEKKNDVRQGHSLPIPTIPSQHIHLKTTKQTKNQEENFCKTQAGIVVEPPAPADHDEIMTLLLTKSTSVFTTTPRSNSSISSLMIELLSHKNK